MKNLWTELYENCIKCQKCELSKTRTNVVFGDGNPNSKIMLVGEGPGEQEDVSGLAFVGTAGKLLDKYLDYIELDRHKVYIANVIKCRPPQNRDPFENEQTACMEWFRFQVRLIKPKIIVCLGRIAAKKLIGDDFKITADHGKWYDRGNFKIMATYHPAALLRVPDKKGDALDDFISLERKITELRLNEDNGVTNI